MVGTKHWKTEVEAWISRHGKLYCIISTTSIYNYLSTSVRRLPLLLRRRRRGAASYIPPEDASPRRHHNKQPTIPLQPVCHRADDLHYNQSATEQTTSSTASLQPSRCRRPLPQPVYSYRVADNHYTIGARSHRRRTADARRRRR